MGFDFLDIVLRLEKAFFPFKIEQVDVNQMFKARTAQTITAGDIYDFMLSRLSPRWSPVARTGSIDFDLFCAVCRYNLRGLGPDHACPECGTPLQFEAHVWHGVSIVLADA